MHVSLYGALELSYLCRRAIVVLPVGLSSTDTLSHKMSLSLSKARKSHSTPKIHIVKGGPNEFYCRNGSILYAV